MRRYCLASGSLFTLITAVWTLRLLTGTSVMVAGTEVPLWASVVPIAVAGSLAIWAFRIAMHERPAAR